MVARPVCKLDNVFRTWNEDGAWKAVYCRANTWNHEFVYVAHINMNY